MGGCLLDRYSKLREAELKIGYNATTQSMTNLPNLLKVSHQLSYIIANEFQLLHVIPLTINCDFVFVPEYLCIPCYYFCIHPVRCQASRRVQGSAVEHDKHHAATKSENRILTGTVSHDRYSSRILKPGQYIGRYISNTERLTVYCRGITTQQCSKCIERSAAFDLPRKRTTFSS